MGLTHWLIAAWLTWLAAAWFGAFNMNQNVPTTNEALDTNRPQMVREFWSWEMKEFRWPRMDNFLTNLSEEDQEAVKSVMDEFREAEKAFFEKLDAATTDEEKDSIREEWDASKTSYQEKLQSLVWEDNDVSNFFQRGWKGPMGEMNWERPEMPEMNGERPEMPEMNGERPELPDFENGERPELPEMNGERPELPNFENGERPEMPTMNGMNGQQRPEMNRGFGGPRGEMKGNPQGQQTTEEVK